MKQLLPYLMCVGMVMSAPALAAAPAREAESQVTVQGTVEAVDHAAPQVTIRLLQGRVVTLGAPLPCVSSRSRWATPSTRRTIGSASG